MKKIFLVIAAFLLNGVRSDAQMSLAHSYTKQAGTESEVVNLALSGKKILTVYNNNSWAIADTLFFYNMDYSFWKSIPCPLIPGYAGQFNLFHELGQDIGIFYPSETLFNLDTFLEVAIRYQGSVGHPTKILVINETGAIVDSILNVYNFYSFKVYKIDTSSLGFQALVSTASGIEVYNLPGTLPCDICENNFGLAGLRLNTKDVSNSIPTQPAPNPSANQVKISFKLPYGANRGELDLYTTNGQKIKTYQVDNRFGFILLDNTELPAGLYYYNIVSDGAISATQKLVLVK